jgi:hypothetical protein
MSKVFCLVPSHWTNQQLIKDFGEETAYHIVHLNKGNDLTKAPNGKGSLLYDELGEMFGYGKALRHKAFFYTTDFRNKFGDWTGQNSIPKLTNDIKPGVSELFKSNPELANAVYEALGFKKSPNINNVTFDEILEEVSFEEIINKDKEQLHNSNRSQIYLDLINKISPNTKFKIVKNLKIKGKSVSGVYTFKGDIYISRNTYQWLNEGKTLTKIDLKTILHEVIHKEVGNRFEQEKLANTPLYKEFIPIFLAAQKLQGQGYYGMTNPNEFLSEAITNIEFQDALRNISSIKTKGNTNLFNDIIEFVKNLIGINTIENTLLEDVFKISERLIKESKFNNDPIEQQALQLYSQYLDTIFPDSQVKDIVYHGTGKFFERFEKAINSVKKHSIFFTTNKKSAKEHADLRTKDKGLIIAAIINALNPKKVEHINNEFIINDFSYGKNDSLIKDSGTYLGEEGSDITVNKPEQIHILGSKQDIEGFKEFVNNNSKKQIINQEVKEGVSELFDSNPELANEVYEALGFEIPTTKLQGKQFEYGEPRFFDVVEELTSGERASLPSSILINKLLKGEYLPEIKESQIILGLSEAGIWRPNIKKIEASGENKSTLAKKIGHELLHSVTNNIILSYQNLKGTVDFTDKYYKDFIKQGYIKPVDLSKSQIEALDNLVRIRNKVISYVEQNKDKIQKQDRGFGTYDYFIRTNYTESETDLHEFISEVFTNPELINILKEIPTEGKKSNLFKDFVDAIAKILGFTNTSILEDIIAYSEEAFFTQPQITPQQKQQALQLYSQYLDTIFPDSKVKDIVYRGSQKEDTRLFQYWTKNETEAYMYAKV